MRNVIAVIDQITAVLTANPSITTPDEFATLQAELRILRKRAQYGAPEADTSLWTSIGIALYRYLPPVAFSGPTLQVSNIIRGL